MGSKYMNIEEVAAYTGTPPGTLRYWRHIGTGPRSFKIGTRVAYRTEDVEQWIAEQEAETARGGVPA